MAKTVYRRNHRQLLSTGLLAVALFNGASAIAGQTAFSRQTTDETMRLDYRFEAARVPTPLSFSVALPAAAIRATENTYRRFNPRDLERRIAREQRRLLSAEVEVLKRSFPEATITLEGSNRVRYALSPASANEQLRRARRRDIEAMLSELRRRYPHVQITYQAGSGRVLMRGLTSASEQRELDAVLGNRMRALEAQARLRLRRLSNQARANSQQIARRLDRAIARVYRQLDDAEQGYLKARYYAKNSASSIQPDYARIARESLASYTPVARAWSKHRARPPSRAGINELLGFFQSIPYDTLESRNSSNGAGFAMPLALLARNRGDCDTKSVAMATLLHALAPEIPTIMVLLRDHALLGFAVKARPGDTTLQHNGRTYVLAEPVGPALLPLGTIGKRSAQRAQQILQLFDPATLPRR